jgi:hypothetical protein
MDGFPSVKVTMPIFRKRSNIGPTSGHARPHTQRRGIIDCAVTVGAPLFGSMYTCC